MSFVEKLLIGALHIVKRLHGKELVGSLAGCPASASLLMTLLDFAHCRQTFPGANNGYGSVPGVSPCGSIRMCPTRIDVSAII